MPNNTIAPINVDLRLNRFINRNIYHIQNAHAITILSPKRITARVFGLGIVQHKRKLRLNPIRKDQNQIGNIFH